MLVNLEFSGKRKDFLRMNLSFLININRYKQFLGTRFKQHRINYPIWTRFKRTDQRQQT